MPPIGRVPGERALFHRESSSGPGSAPLLGDRRQAEKGRAHLLAGEETTVDVGRIRFGDGRARFFMNVLGVGFDAEVAGRARDVRGAISSIPAHVVGFASALAVYQNKHIAITLGAEDAEPVR